MFISAEKVLAHLVSIGFTEDGSTKKVHRLYHPSLSHLIHIKKPNESTNLILAIPLEYNAKLSQVAHIPKYWGVGGKSSNYKGYTPAGGTSNPALTFDFKSMEELNTFTILMFGLRSKVITPDNSLLITETTSLTKARIGQDKFRNTLINYWSNACSVTGCTVEGLLLASHIIPWSEEEQSRLDPFNGLLLTPNLDAAFDKGYISFSDNGDIIISPMLSVQDQLTLGLHPSMKLRRIEAQHKAYLAWHRENLFKA